MKRTLTLSILCVTTGLSAASSSNALNLTKLSENTKHQPTPARLKSFMQRNAPGTPWHKTYQEHILSSDYDWKTSFMDRAGYATQHGDTQKAFLYTFYAATELCQANEFKEAHKMLNAINYAHAPKEMRATFVALNARILSKLNSKSTFAKLEQEACEYFKSGRDTQGYHSIYRAVNELVSMARLWRKHANKNYEYIEYAHQYYLMAKKMIDNLSLKAAPQCVTSKFMQIKKEINYHTL